MNLRKPTRWKRVQRGANGRKVLCDEALPLSAKVYHLLEWQYAEKVFQHARLRLSPVKAWLDPFENWWCERLFSRPDSPLAGVNAYALCWTQSKYDEPSWRMVGYGRSEPIVRIRCSVDDLLEAAQCQLGSASGSWFLGRVRYRRVQTLRALSERLQPRHAIVPLKDVSRTAASLLNSKRRAFRFEEEVRLLFLSESGAAPAAETFLPIDLRIVTQVMTSPFAGVARKVAIDGLKPFGRVPLESRVLSAPSWMKSP